MIIVLGEILIFDFLAYKHVLRPQDAKKPVFKKSLYVCVCVCVCVCTYVRTYVCNRRYFRCIVVLRPNFFFKIFFTKKSRGTFFFFNLDVTPHLFTRKYLYLKICFLLDILNLFWKFFPKIFVTKKYKKHQIFFLFGRST